MSTRLNDTDTELRRDQVTDGPKIWPWIILSIVAAAILWWSVANHNRMADQSVGTGTTSGAGMTGPGAGGGAVGGGTGTGSMGAGGLGTSGTPGTGAPGGGLGAGSGGAGAGGQ